MKRFFAGALLFAAMLFMVGCGTAGKNPDTQPPPEEAATMGVAVYYVKDAGGEMYLVREVHEVKTPSQHSQLYEAALGELIRGKPQTGGAFTVLPRETQIREVSVEDKTATVNFSKEVLHANVGADGEALGIQSIVNTLTEFAEIERIAFEVEGGLDERARDWWGHVGLEQQPFVRNLSSVHEPAIWVEEPVPNQKVSAPLRVKGSARVFEATVNLRLLSGDGKVLEETFATATEGAPGRGEFTALMEKTPPAGSKAILEVFWSSPKDGSEVDKVCLPLQFE